MIVLLTTKLPEITRISGSDCFEAYGIRLSAIEVHTDLEAYDTSGDMTIKALKALVQDIDVILVIIKLAESDIRYALETVISHPDALLMMTIFHIPVSIFPAMLTPMDR